MKYQLNVELSDMYKGAELNVNIKHKKICLHCKGTGADSPNDNIKCPQCNGKGSSVIKQQVAPGFYIQRNMQCDACGGRGEIISKPCDVCKGRKIIEVDKQLLVKIAPGTVEDHEVIFYNEGNESPGYTVGDVKFVLKSRTHPIFTRKDSDLLITLDISLREALIGFTREITHLDDHIVHIKKDNITNPGDLLIIKNEGFPSSNNSKLRGDIYITLVVNFPYELTSAQKDEIYKLLKKMKDFLQVIIVN